MVRTVVLDAEDAPISPDAVSTVTTENPHDQAYVPPDEHFGEGEDFRADERIERIAADLIADKPEFRHLQSARVDVCWKQKGGKKGGQEVLGRANKLSGLAYFYGGFDFTIWLAADHCRDWRITNHQLEALIYHELKHCGFEYDAETKKTTWVIWNHDAELFIGEIHNYGYWRPALKLVGDTVAQLALDVNAAS